MRSTSSSAGCQASHMRWTLQCHALTLSGRYLYASSARYLYTSPGGRHEEMARRVPRRRGGSLIVRRAPGAGAGLGRRPPPGARGRVGRDGGRHGRRRRARRPHRPARPPRLGDAAPRLRGVDHLPDHDPAGVAGAGGAAGGAAAGDRGAGAATPAPGSQHAGFRARAGFRGGGGWRAARRAPRDRGRVDAEHERRRAGPRTHPAGRTDHRPGRAAPAHAPARRPRADQQRSRHHPGRSRRMSTEHDAEVIDLAVSRPATAPTAAPLVDHNQDNDGPRVLVDSPDAQRRDRPDPRTAQRRPVLAAWLRSRAELRVTLGWALRYAAHVAAFHAVRAPTIYLGRLALRSPRGAWRIARATFRWVTDWEGHPVRLAAVEQVDAAAYLRLSRQRNERVKARAWMALLAALPLGAAAVAVALLAGPVTRVLAVAAAVAVLGAFGRRPDRPLLDTAVTVHKVPKLTSEIVRRALAVAVPEIRAARAKDPGAVEFVDPIQRDGQGYRAPVNLPYGVTVGDVMGARARLASGLSRQLGCVWPAGDPGQHEGRLVLWVGDRDLAELRGRKGLPWALAQAGRHDIFHPVPFGADPRGRPVAVPLFQHNVLIGSIPGQGKTGSLTVLACGCALDPLAELQVHELKGSGDLDGLEQVAHRFVSGIDDDSIAYAADSLTLLRSEVVRRTGALKKLPRDLCPDKRVTRQIAERRSLGLHPVACVIDEAQNLFAHPVYGAQAAADAKFIIRIGRAFGVILIRTA